MGSIYLIRHGQASFGAENYDVLSPLGFQQSAALGDYLDQMGIRFDRCVSGELNRQQDTARATLQQMSSRVESQLPPLVIDAAFNEFRADEVIRAHMDDLLAVEPGAMQVFANAANHRAEFQRLFKYVIQRWVSGDHEKQGLESWQSFVNGVRAGLSRLLEQADKKDNIAVFTSGGTITALLQLIIGVSPIKAFELNWQIVNTSLSRLKYRDQDVALASFNSHAHLELLKNPELVTYR
ncbi:phosphoglycerate mutase family protein [Pseudomonas stutzeri]|jgi:broad specificity phosphatase PhoE|uniref:histidine phosphatase family protein n=1 Tax=Stutzerimonas stutzeri TaxID=316 RepID=UPI000C479957|nr:histidine phosphatase family protein [Stutzerimonas stutzeri]MBK59280.1 histidine phosphatase family protein [Pseudomonas sp.]MCQ4278143.1 phosphoglycerate mutase family protein [Stutzerimonas stutzeri]PNF74098.1 histidine phosphatase family protein [Stutzerimonas stutzeri]|tara:strand:+ start:11445 stop:12158 length:714 start_codon:yes stop_codon:yes gene_type:complete